MNQELLPTLIEIISDLRDKRKVGNQTDAEFELEGAIAEYFRQERVYELYLDKINGIRSGMKERIKDWLAVAVVLLGLALLVNTAIVTAIDQFENYVPMNLIIR